jgi:hypothetical protein
MGRYLKSRIKHGLHKLLGYEEKYITQRTSFEAVYGLLQSLRPLTPPAPLIRLGPRLDGGYLVPNQLDGVAALFSPGVSTEAGFEMDCASRGIDVFMADWSVEESPASHPRFSFLKKYLGNSTYGTFISLDEWVNSTGVPPSADLMLQMDIEGAEYEVFHSCSDALLRRLRIIVVEFHSLELLWCEPFFQSASRVFAKLLQTHYVVHAHPNNCCGVDTQQNLFIPRLMEFTFVRGTPTAAQIPVREFPHPLDCDNLPGPPLSLPRNWPERSN